MSKKNAVRVTSWIPLWQIKHIKSPLGSHSSEQSLMKCSFYTINISRLYAGWCPPAYMWFPFLFFSPLPLQSQACHSFLILYAAEETKTTLC